MLDICFNFALSVHFAFDNLVIVLKIVKCYKIANFHSKLMVKMLKVKSAFDWSTAVQFGRNLHSWYIALQYIL